MEMKTSNLLNMYRELHNNMEKPGMLPLIRCASEIFDAPIVFTNNQYQLISIYPTNKIDDFVYDTLLTTGSLPEETIAAFHEAYLRQPGTRYEPFFEKDGLVESCPRIFAEVYDETTIIGHIAIFLKDKLFETWHLEATSILTSILRIKINLTNQIPSIPSDSLHRLLDRNSSKEVKKTAMNYLSQKLKAPAILLVASLDQMKSQQAFASIAINYCLQKYSCSLPIIYENDLVILLYEDKGNTNLSVIASEISKYLLQYKILCGGVNSVIDLNLLPDYYLQAKLTAAYRYKEELEQNNSDTPLYYYNDIAPFPFFLYLSQQEEAHCFIHPVLHKIKQYDYENDSDLYSTLEGYCKNLFQKNETATDLHIHRNTLNYRLARLEELFELNLKDYKTALSLTISFEMVRHKS